MINLLSTARERAVTAFLARASTQPQRECAQRHPMDCVAACLRYLNRNVPTAPETGLSIKEAELFAARGSLLLVDMYEWDLLSSDASYVLLGLFDGPLGPHANLFLVQQKGITQFEPGDGSFHFHTNWGTVGIKSFNQLKLVYMP